MSSQLESIYSDFKQYFESYEIFQSKSVNQAENEWSEQWSSFVKQLAGDSQLPSSKSLRILLVAAGYGLAEMKILEMILNEYPTCSLVVDVIEPAEDQLKIFQDKAPELMAKYPNRLEFQWFVETFQGYMKIREDNKCEDKFHFLVCLHGLYYFDNWAEALDQFYHLLVNGGKMATAINSGNSACGRLFKNYREWEGVTASLLTSDDIIGHLTSKAYGHQCFPRTGAVDVSAIFDKKSREGNLILDFLVQRKDFRQNAASSLFNKVMDFVKQNSKEEGGKVLMEDDEVDILVTKK